MAIASYKKNNFVVLYKMVGYLYFELEEGAKGAVNNIFRRKLKNGSKQSSGVEKMQGAWS